MTRENLPDSSVPHRDDRRLVAEVRNGEVEARAEFVRRMRIIPRVVSAQNERLGAPLAVQEVEDVIQDVQLDVWKKLDRYEGRAALDTWVYRFCQIGFLRALERRQRRSGVVAYCGIEMIEGFPGAAQRGEDAGEDLANLLRHLSEREVQVTRLRHLEQLEFAEIAKVLDVSVSTAKTHYYRAIEKLKTTWNTQSEVGS